MSWETYIIPPVLTVFLNGILYFLVKKKIEKDVEDFKIVRSGVYAKKIEVYRKLLSFIHSLKPKIHRYTAQANKELEGKIKQEINDFINYLLVHKPFIAKKLASRIDDIRKELQNCFEVMTFRDHEYRKNLEEDEAEQFKEDILNAFNKLRENTPFKKLEDEIEEEMRKELQTDKE